MVKKEIKQAVEWTYPGVLDKYRLEVISEVQEALLKECNNMSWDNGHPLDAVPKSTIKALHELMDVPASEIGRNNMDNILKKFSPEFIKNNFYEPLTNAVMHALAYGRDPCAIIEGIIDNYNTLKKDWETLITQGPRRSAVISNQNENTSQ